MDYNGDIAQIDRAPWSPPVQEEMFEVSPTTMNICRLNLKSRRSTRLIVRTNADSSTGTILERLRDFSQKKKKKREVVWFV